MHTLALSNAHTHDTQSKQHLSWTYHQLEPPCPLPKETSENTPHNQEQLINQHERRFGGLAHVQVSEKGRALV